MPLRRGVFAPLRHTGAPLSLTASDGTGLRLVSLRSRSVVNDPLAFTELHLIFENPQERTLEGTFQITLPPGASISRLSMKMEDRWQEGEVIETQVARQVYEDFLHRRQDPALLEQAAGNEFSARVFPIPARGTKELVISYSQELTQRKESFRLPLGGLPRMERIVAEVFGGDEGQLLGAFRQEQSQPEGDFVVELAEQDRHAGLRSGSMVVARVTPVAEAQADPFGATLLLVDTSASRALGFEAQLRTLEGVAQRIGSAPIAVVAFDQSTETVYEGPASGFGAEALTRLRTRGAFGASGLGAALQEAGASAQAKGWKRLLLVSDGIATAGESEGVHLKEQVAALRASGIERLDAIAVGGIRDDALLKQLSTAGLERDGVVADGAQPIEQIWHRLANRTHSNVPVRVEGARWWSPMKLDGVQSGDEVLVYADVPGASTSVNISLGGRSVSPVLTPAERPLLERSLIRAKINDLLASGTSAEVRQQVIELSTRHRVLSPFTSLLVLETEQDYERYHLDRKALSDVLMVHQGRLSVAGRTTPPEPLEIPRAAPEKDGVAAQDPTERGNTSETDRSPAASAQAAATNAPPPPPAPTATTPSLSPPRPEPVVTRPPAAEPPPAAPPALADKADAATGNMWGQNIGESFGAGGLGLSGIGEGGGGPGAIGRGSGTGTGQGFGMGSGRLGGSHRAPSPQVRLGASTVSGRLPPEVIQRIVRQNFGRYRFCYEQGLRRNPNLQGRMTVRFVIGKDGNVVAAVPGNSNLADAAVVNCVANAFRTLQFPSPEGGIVTVLYPLSFAPPGGHIALDSPSSPGRPEPETPAVATPYSGRFGAVMKTLERDPKAALSEALSWHHQQPADVLALLAVGESHERLGAPVSAARAYGSLIDLFPARADLRRYAAARMERLDKSALPLAIDSLRKAKEQRPDHPSSHRMLALALLRAGQHEEAFKALVEGLSRRYPDGRFLGYERILKEDLGLVAASWKKAEPGRQSEIDKRLKEAGGIAEPSPSLRFVLTWETDNNDVDFHIYDSKGGHAYFSRPKLPGGGELYADVTTGYGPECFTVRKAPSQRPEYTLQAHYYSRGPMGYGMGKLEVIEHDGKGGLAFEERPFVIMQDHAYIDLGKVSKLTLPAP